MDKHNLVCWLTVSFMVVVLVLVILIYKKVNESKNGPSLARLQSTPTCKQYPCYEVGTTDCSIATEANKFGFNSDTSEMLMTASIYCPDETLAELKKAKPNTTINPSCMIDGSGGTNPTLHSYPIKLGNSPAPCNSTNYSFMGCSQGWGVMPYVSTTTNYPTCM